MHQLENMNGFVAETEPPLPTNGSFTASNVYAVRRRESNTVAWDATLFVRKDLVCLEEKVMKEFWTQSKKTTLYVRGPPGSGKTCFFYLWARLRSVQDSKSILVIQFRENAPNYIWIRQAGGELWRAADGIEQDALRQRVDEILKAQKDAGKHFDLCIHDGVIQGKQICTSMLSKLNTAVANGRIGKVVHVTSLAFSLSTGGQRLDPDGDIVRLSLNSWNLQDYEEAIVCTEFVDRMKSQLSKDVAYLAKMQGRGKNEPRLDDAAQHEEKMCVDDDIGVSRPGDAANEEYMFVDDDGATKIVSWTDVLETKYFWAGGSARFMFEFPLSSLKEELDERCRLVPDNEWKHFVQGAVAPTTPSAVNTLMQQFELTSSPVSKYILFRAYERCKTKLVKAVKAAARNSSNPALKGWAFELEQIDLIRLSVESPQASPEYITNSHGFSFSPGSSIEYDEQTLANGTISKEGAVIWCMKWNQGCFDIAYCQEKTLVTIQFTVSEEHSLKPNFIRKLREALIEHGVMVDRCLHVGVSDTEDNNFQFKLETSGTGRQRNAEEAPQFTIQAYHSPPLEKKCGTAAFKAQFSTPILEEVSMWELGTNKRSRTI